jgi:uncharacterized Zn finger protein (UPF0148 family)
MNLCPRCGYDMYYEDGFLWCDHCGHHQEMEVEEE